MIENSTGPITQELLHKLFYYDAISGKLINRINRGRRAIAGKEAGCINTSSNGRKHISIRINSKLYLAHRLIWLYHYGYIDNDIGMDHINGNTLDNRIENLRLATQSENLKNQSINKNNTSGITGVYRHKQTNKWRCLIRVNGKQIYGGYFTNIEDAIKKRKELEEKYGFHENHGRKKVTDND